MIGKIKKLKRPAQIMSTLAGVSRRPITRSEADPMTRPARTAPLVSTKGRMPVAPLPPGKGRMPVSPVVVTPVRKRKIPGKG